MQIAGITSLGLLIAGGVLAVLLRSRGGGNGRGMLAQSLAGITIGLAAALTVLILLTDLVPDQMEWIAAAAMFVVAVAIGTAVRLRYTR